MFEERTRHEWHQFLNAYWRQKRMLREHENLAAAQRALDLSRRHAEARSDQRQRTPSVGPGSKR